MLTLLVSSSCSTILNLHRDYRIHFGKVIPHRIKKLIGETLDSRYESGMLLSGYEPISMVLDLWTEINDLNHSTTEALDVYSYITTQPPQRLQLYNHSIPSTFTVILPLDPLNVYSHITTPPLKPSTFKVVFSFLDVKNKIKYDDFSFFSS